MKNLRIRLEKSGLISLKITLVKRVKTICKMNLKINLRSFQTKIGLMHHRMEPHINIIIMHQFLLR